MIDWQTVANVTTSLAVVIAVVVFLWEVRSSRRERSLSVFVRMLDSYKEIMIERSHKWRLVKERVKANLKTSREVGDKTSSLDYLLTRIQQLDWRAGQELEVEVSNNKLIVETNQSKNRKDAGSK